MPPLGQVLLTPSEEEQLDERYVRLAGTQDQYIQHVRFDAFPEQQRRLGKTTAVKHSHATRTMVHAFQAMRDPARDWNRPFDCEDLDIEDINASLDTLKENHKAVYLTRLHLCESGIARQLRMLIAGSKSIRSIDPGKAIEWVQGQLAITLAENQRKAIVWAVENKVMVITGGPGTGKTTIIHAVLKISARLKSYGERFSNFG